MLGLDKTCRYYGEKYKLLGDPAIKLIIKAIKELNEKISGKGDRRKRGPIDCEFVESEYGPIIFASDHYPVTDCYVLETLVGAYLIDHQDLNGMRIKCRGMWQ